MRLVRFACVRQMSLLSIGNPAIVSTKSSNVDMAGNPAKRRFTSSPSSLSRISSSEDVAARVKRVSIEGNIGEIILFAVF